MEFTFQRTDMTEVNDYLMNKAGIYGPPEEFKKSRIDPRFSKLVWPGPGPTVFDFSNFPVLRPTGFWSVNPWIKENQK